MKILTTLFPVFIMMALGFISRLKQWLTPDQKEGAKRFVFGVLSSRF
jgi:predicted permease